MLKALIRDSFLLNANLLSGGYLSGYIKQIDQKTDIKMCECVCESVSGIRR